MTEQLTLATLGIETKVVPSRSRPGREYTIFRVPGGRWQHSDGRCEGFAHRKECWHMSESNTRAVAVIPASGGDPLTMVDELETAAIIESLAGKVTPAWAYDIPIAGGRAKDLSVRGVDQAARYMATKGEVLRILDCKVEYEDGREARFFSVAGRYAVNSDGREVLLDTAVGAKRQSKYIKLRQGGEQFNEHWYEVGVRKACRNAKAALIDDEVRQHIIRMAGGGKAAQQPGTRLTEEKRPPTEHAPTEEAKPAPEGNGSLPSPDSPAPAPAPMSPEPVEEAPAPAPGGDAPIGQSQIRSIKALLNGVGPRDVQVQWLREHGWERALVVAEDGEEAAQLGKLTGADGVALFDQLKGRNKR